MKPPTGAKEIAAGFSCLEARRRSLWSSSSKTLALLTTVGFILLHGTDAFAVVEGTAPAKVGDFRLFGSHSATGAAVLVPGPSQSEINSILLPSATAQITDLPFDAEVVAAYLFWSGSTPRTLRGQNDPPDGPDFDVDFTTADGTFYNNLSALSDPTGFGRCVETGFSRGGFYYCRRDVTDIIRNQGPGNANGIYEVGDLEVDAGSLNPFDGQRIFAQAKYGGWSLLLVWEAPSENIRRDVVLYDGFLQLDEQTFPTVSGGVTSFVVDDFVVGSPALGKLTVFGMEGDGQLGVPPQDSTGCPTCFDFISVQAQSQAMATKLSDGANPPNNSFNSSFNGQASIDIDTYNLAGLVETGDTQATVTVGSGDGIVPGGDGESFFIGWVIMTLDTLTPNFAGIQSRKQVSPVSAGGGQRLFYTIDLVNEGSLAATGVVLTDAIPAGTTYVPDSTRLDGVLQADVGGTSPLVSGLSLGTIPTIMGGDHTRQVTFEVRVEDTACGTAVSNTAVVTANEIEPTELGPAITNVEVPVIDQPIKRLSFISPPPAGPGAAYSYAIEITNSGSIPAGGITVTDTLPEDMEGITVITPPGATFSLVGKDLTVDDISIDAGDTEQVLIFGRVRTVSEFLTAGISEDSIHNRVVSNQATVSGGCTPAQLTDDPDLPGQQATEFAIFYAPDLALSSKGATDANGAPLEPGDTVSFAVNVVNSGNRSADVVVTDVIPANTTYVPNSTTVDGVPVADIAGNSPLLGGLTLPSIPFVGDNDRTVVFEVTVDLLAPNGAVVQNTADLGIPVFPAGDTSVSSAPLVVFAQPSFLTSTKTVTDLTPGAYEPGDQIEYTISVVNDGNRPGTNTLVTDTLPGELTFVSAAPAPTSVMGATLSWDLGSVPRDTTTLITITAQINSPLDNGTVVSNAATIDADEVPPFTTPPVNFSITSQPVLVVTKADEHPTSPVRPGDITTYRIRIRNEGNMVARNVVVTDAVDSNLTAVAAPTGTVSPGQVQWDSGSDVRLGAIDLGAPNEVELVFSAQVVTPLPNGTIISNQATAAPEGFAPTLSDDPDTVALNDPTQFSVVSSFTLTFTKRVDDPSPSTPPLPGTTMSYTLEVSVQGDAPARDVVVTDDIGAQAPALTNVVPAGGTFGGGVLTWSAATGSPALAVMNPGDTVALLFDADIAPGTPDGTVVSNQASLDSIDLGTSRLSDGDTGTGGDQPTTFVVVSEPVLSITKTVALEGDDDSAFNPGDLVRYSLQVSNVGTDAATDVVVTDPVDSNITVEDAGGGQAITGGLQWTSAEVAGLGTIAPGGTVNLSFAARIAFPLDNGTPVGNQAEGTGGNVTGTTLSDDPAEPGDTDPTVFVVESAPIFVTSTKAVSDLTVDPLVTRPGDILRYTIVVENTGDSDADNVVVTDTVPSFVSVTPPANASFDGSVLTWDASTEPQLGSVPAGGSVVLTFDVQVDAPLANGTVISNQAEIRSDEVSTPVPTDDPATATVDDPTTVMIVSSADLGASTKIVTDPSGTPITEARPGDSVRYLLTVENRGDAPAIDVTVTDLLDAALLPVAAPGGQISGQTVVFDPSTTPGLATMGSGDRIDFIIDVELRAGLVDGQQILNQGDIDAANLASTVATDADLSTISREPTVLVVRAEPDISIRSKVFRNPFDGSLITEARPGDIIRMEITLRNTGDGAAPNVVVTDDLDTSILSNILPRDGGALAGTTVTWNAGNLLPGAAEERLLRVDAQIRSPLDPSILVNQAFVSMDGGPAMPTDDPALPGLADPSELPIIAEPDFTASTKDVVGDRTVDAGAEVTYQITVSNTGDGNARDVVVADVLAPELEFVGGGGAFDSGTRTVTWNLPLVGGGDSETVQLVARVVPGTPNGTMVPNQATISAPAVPDELTDDPDVGVTDSPTLIDVRSAPRLTAFTKTVVNLDRADGQLLPGDRLQYTLDVTNEGNEPATGVEIRDPLDPSLEDPQSSTSFQQLGSTLVFDASDVPAFASLAPGGNVQILFSARVGDGVPNGTIIANQATVDASNADQVLSDADLGTEPRESTDIVVAFPEIVAIKSVEDLTGGAPVEPGDQLRFTIQVDNVGAFAANGILVTDPVDAGFLIESAPGATQIGNSLTWNVGTLAAGGSEVFTIDVQVPVGTVNATQLLNQATVQGGGIPPVLSDWTELPGDEDPVVVDVVATPEFQVATKSVSVGGEPVEDFVSPGDTLNYSLVFENQGKGPGTQVTVTDVIDPSLDVLAIGSGGVLTDRTITWDLGTVDVDEQVNLDLTVRVRTGTASRTVVSNQAFIGADELTSPVPTDDPRTPVSGDATDVRVLAEPQFTGTLLTVSDLNGGVVQPGDRLRYQIQVLNDGTRDATETVARLPLPGFTFYVPGTTTLNGAAVPDGGLGSALATGLEVSSQRAGTPSGTVWLDDGLTPADEVALVTFDVTVDPRALAGTEISAQATVSSALAPPTGSDNPLTSGIAGDPTVVIVGGGGQLAVSKFADVVDDVANNGVADVGDTLRYRVDIHNGGNAAALGAVLTDLLNPNLSYVPLTMTLDGEPLSDAVDADSGEVVGPQVNIRLPDLAPNGAAAVTFDAVVTTGVIASNQAQVALGGRITLSDGDPGAPGAQPTVTPLGTNGEAMTVSLDVTDINGGALEPGDAVRYGVLVSNAGPTQVESAFIRLGLGTTTSGLRLVDAGGTDEVDGGWRAMDLGPGQRVRVEVETNVSTTAEIGAVVDALGSAETSFGTYESELSRLVVGGGIGTGAFGGVVFRERGERDGRFDPTTDEVPEGLSVLVIPEGNLNTQLGRGAPPTEIAIRTVDITTEGVYRAAGLPPGRYYLWAATAEGTVYAQNGPVAINAGALTGANLPIDPSGVIYQEIDGAARAVEGVRVFLVDTATGQDVPAASLQFGGQGQRTTSQGFYRFLVRQDALPGQFSIRVETGSPTLTFPSVLRPPAGSTAAEPLGAIAQAGPDGRVVQSDFPDLAGDTTYFLRFDLDGSQEYFNNHIPLDRLDQRIQITKIASRRTATIGEVVTYTITVSNPTSEAITMDGAGNGGVTLVDDMPDGMEVAINSAVRTTTVGGQVQETVRLGVQEETARQVRFDAFDLPANSMTEVRYHATVGIRARGVQENRVRLFFGNTPISPEAAARVRVVDDPIFDEGTVLGRVFCDDGNGVFDGQDEGLAGARVFLDTGFYVDTDIEGKFHFRGVKPGQHVIKLDLNTAPPGSTTSTDQLRDFYLTRGLLAKMDFGVRCALESVGPSTVDVVGEPPITLEDPTEVALVVDPSIPAVSLSGEAQTLTLVDAVLSRPGSTPDFASGKGINLASPGKLVWHIQSPTQLVVAAWEVSVFTVEGEEVWRVRGRGAPPKRVPWELTEEKNPLQAGQEYVYRVAVRTPGGDLGEGRWRRLGYRLGGETGEAAAGEPPPPIIWRGKLFAGDTDKLSPDLRKRVTAFVTKSASAGGSPAKLRIEVHSAGGGKRTAALLLSQRQANALAAQFAKVGYPENLVRGVGRGDMKPLVPNITRKGREKNRRVELHVESGAPKVEDSAAAPLAYPGWLVFNGEAKAPGDKLNEVLQLRDGDGVAVDLRRSDGRRVRLNRTFPFGEGQKGSGPTVTLPLFGSLTRGTLTIGEDTVVLPLLTTQCGVDKETHTLSPEGLSSPVRFRMNTEAEVKHWTVRVLNPSGAVLTDIEGTGTPPKQIEWSGTNATGATIVRPGDYQFRCLLADVSGNRTVTGLGDLRFQLADAVSAPQASPETGGGDDKPREVFAAVLAGDVYPNTSGVVGAAANQLDAAAKAAADNPGSKVVVEVHDDADGGKTKALIRTARLANTLKEYLTGKGVSADNLELISHGANRPKMPGASRRARLLNRRVEIRVTAPAVETPPTPPPAPPQPPALAAPGSPREEVQGPVEVASGSRAKVAGEALKVATDGSFSGSVVVENDAVLTVELATEDGRTAIYNVPLFEGRPASAASAEDAMPVSGPPPAETPRIGTGTESLSPGYAPEPAQSPVAVNRGVLLASFEGHPGPRESLRGATGVDAVAGYNASLPEHPEVSYAPPNVVPASGEPRLESPSGPHYNEFPASGPHYTYPASGPRLANADTPEHGALVVPSGFAERHTVPAESVSGVAATDFTVALPPDGSELGGERLAVRGRTGGTNIIRINGERVALDEQGGFVKVLTLAPGQAAVEVTSEDEAGNIARVSRTYTVPSSEWFLLAMADGVVGIGDKLEGMNDKNSVDFDREVYLHGRAVAYFKGRIKGSALFEANPFKDVRLTAFVDTGKEAEADVMRQLIDPDRYYAVYGDSTEEVQDVSSGVNLPGADIGQLYVLLEADRSKLRLGNFQVNMTGIELFRFQRSYYGGYLDMDHEFAEGHRTQLKAMAATGESGVRHRQILLQGTGGAMYFLRDGDILEGSERVWIVVRDEITGARLVQIPLTRNVDYTIEYRDGRLIFSQPIPNTVLSGWRLNQNSLRTYEGHPVFVEVEYDYQGGTSVNDDASFGAQARHTIEFDGGFNSITLGGGVVDEDRRQQTGLRYRLYGGEMQMKLLDRTQIELEFAYSESVDGDHLASYDGGITYGRLGTPDLSAPERRGTLTPGEVNGWAGLVRVSGDIGDYLGKTGGDGPSSLVPYTVYASRQTTGFYSGSSILEQGQSKIGGQFRWIVTPEDTVRLRHDAVWSWVFLDNEDRRIVRNINTVGYEHKEKTWTVGAEVGNNTLQDAVDTVHTTTLNVFGDVQLVERLRLTAEQEVAAVAAARYFPDVTDRFATTVGLQYEVKDDLWLSATETVRWNGNNSTQLGVKAQVNDGLSMYASERFTAGAGRTVSTTVVGAESHAIPGSRSYAEYQLDALSSGRNGRAVFGMDNEWELTEGLTLALSYERAQVTGPNQITSTTNLGNAVGDPTVAGVGAGALALDQQFSAAGYSSSAVFPAGVASRDAFSIGMELLRWKAIKANARFEMRYDRADDAFEIPDRLVLFGQATGEYRLDRNFVLLTRTRGATVQNVQDDFTEAQFLDLTVGMALRPSYTDRYGALFKYTRRYDRQATTFGDPTQFQLEVADVISLEPYFEIGAGFQLVGKFAAKVFEVTDAELPAITSTTVLALGRVNYHLASMFDASVEYRWLANSVTNESEHGALVEFSWIPVRYAAVGVGYNFTHFSDDLLADPEVDNHGFFLRVTGRY